MFTNSPGPYLDNDSFGNEIVDDAGEITGLTSIIGGTSCAKGDDPTCGVTGVKGDTEAIDSGAGGMERFGAW